ncbi:hypothetical protein TrLO_g11381 [Triparma laevis f. longispina]|uniref:Uncharacterized protein n=1 Tax=Triparma laevis f. longispina TaxID=1714387 RepID=A0A9W7C1F5_9STRA|nr:hypothetical protein TrLO_g11381 [Triparma laevis f. longispina]
MVICSACTFAETPIGEPNCMICDTPLPSKKSKTGSEAVEIIDVDADDENGEAGDKGVWKQTQVYDTQTMRQCQTPGCTFPACATWTCKDETWGTYALGNRKKCETLCRTTLTEKEGVPVIDRTNIDVKQRSHWYNIAAEFGGKCVMINFEIEKEVCVERCMARTGHPTLNTPGSIKTITNMMSGMKKKSKLKKEEFAGIEKIFVVKDEKSFENALEAVKKM